MIGIIHHSSFQPIFRRPVASGLYYKSLIIVIYDRNDSMMIEPVLWNYDYDHNL
jgi:hypothetical protein